jgi:hypothetical protein
LLNFDMSTIARLPSPRSGRLEAEAVNGERVQAVIKGGASPKPSVLAIDSVLSAFCRLPISAEPVSCSLRSSLATNDAPATV